MSFDIHALTLLEFNKIQERVASYALSEEGKSAILQSQVESDFDKAFKNKEAVRHIVKALGLHELSGAHFPSITLPLKRLPVEGYSLELSELFDIGVFSLSVETLIAWILTFKEIPIVYDYALLFPSLKKVSDIVFKILTKDGELRDLPELRDIRSRIIRLHKEIDSLTQNYLQNENSKYMLQSELPTQRDGRTVLAVKANYKGRIKGIVHEVSATGQTIYVEPEDLLEKNNDIVQEEARFKQEVMRIVRKTTDDLRPFYAEIKEALQAVVLFDGLLSRARYSINTKGNFAFESKGELILKKARHPLLNVKPVPIDLSLDVSTRTLIITGPNTGGKTVTLKTLGLFAAMNQFGLAIPADEGSHVPLFDSVFADIGDEQSLSQSLSTFSAHMKNISSITSQATKNSLVLLDELGSGTDPEEGSAIAMALLDHFINTDCLTVITTHHGILKNYGYSKPKVKNASVDFNKETLSPTYRIVMGIPGESHALDIAYSNGLDERIVKGARSYLHEEQTDIAELIRGLKSKHEELDKAELLQDERLKDLLEKQRKADLKALTLKQKERELKEEGAIALKRLLLESRKNLENLVRELKEGELTREKTLKVKEFIANLEEASKREDEALNIEKEKELNELLSDEAIKEGSFVLVGKNKRKGQVIRKAKKGYWVVETDSIKLTVSATDLVAIVESKKEKPLLDYSLSLNGSTLARYELDVRGMRYEEVIKAMQNQMDACALSNLDTFSVIHGMGEGVLQKAVHEYLKHSNAVADYYFSRPEEGGFGKTIVKLK